MEATMGNRLDSPAVKSRSLLNGNLVSDFKEKIHRAEQKAIERAKVADKVVREHSYQTIGLALCVGALIGVFAGRRRKA